MGRGETSPVPRGWAHWACASDSLRWTGWGWANPAPGRRGELWDGLAGPSLSGGVRGRPLNSGPPGFWKEPTRALSQHPTALRPCPSIPDCDVSARQAVGTEDCRFCCLGCWKRSPTVMTAVWKLLLPLRSEQLRTLVQLHACQPAQFLTAFAEGTRIQAPGAPFTCPTNIYQVLRICQALC